MSHPEFRSKKIKIFRNGDVYSHGKKMVVSGRVFRNYEQFLLQIATDVQLNSGAVRKLFTVEGAPVRGLDDLVDGGMYVASGGDSFKKVPYLINDEPPAEANVDIKSKRLQSRLSRHRRSMGMLNSDINEVFNKKEKPIFSPTTKAFKIMVFSNGDPSEPVKVLLNYRNCRSFEQLNRYLSSLLQLPTGQVRRLYDATNYRRLEGLKDLQDGQNIIAVAHESLKKMNYQLIDPLFKPPPLIDAPRIAQFFPNGDPYHSGISVSVTRKRFSTLSKLLDTLNNQIELVTGKIQKVYSLDPEGVKVNAIEEIEGGKNYVVVANNDPLIRIRYNTKAIQTVHNGPVGLAGFTMKNEHMSHIRHVSKRYPKQPSFKNQSSFQEATQPLSKPQQEPQSRHLSVKRQPSAKKESDSARQSAVSRGKTAASEGVGTTPEPYEEPHLVEDDSNEKEEVYGEQDIKELTSKEKISRTPNAKSKTPDPRSVAASPEPAASSIGSPRPVRSAVMSPQSQARSALVSPQSQARAAVDPRSGLTSAKSRVSAVDNESEAHDTDLDESRVASPEPLPPKTPQSKRSSNEALKVGATETTVSSSSRKQSQSEAKSKSGTKSNLASKPDLGREGSEPALTKSVKGSKDALAKSQKSSRENLKTPKTPKTPVGA